MAVAARVGVVSERLCVGVKVFKRSRGVGLYSPVVKGLVTPAAAAADGSSEAMRAPDYVKTSPQPVPLESFDALHSFLSNKLDKNIFVKATQLNSLFHQCQSLEQLDKAKEILAKFRKSSSRWRDSQAMVVIQTCRRLGVAEEALKMALDPVKYGLFPRRNASVALLVALERESNVEGIRRTIKLMKHLETKFTGIEHYLLAKAMFTTLLREKESKAESKAENSKDGEESSEEHKAEMKEGIAEEEEPNEEGKEESSGESKAEKEESSGESIAEEEEVEKEEKQLVEVTLEELGPTLQACRECYTVSVDHGSRAMYLVNGVLLRTQNGVQVSTELLDKLEVEAWLGDNVIMNMRLDNRVIAKDLSGLLAVLQTKEARSIPISRKKLPMLMDVFLKCENESIRQSFLDLKLT